MSVAPGHRIDIREAGMATEGTGRQASVVSMRPRGGALARHDDGGLDPGRLATALGWFSLGLGVAELLAPGTFARAIGLKGAGVSRTVTRAVGLREIASGIGILAERRPVGWMWSRVAGDVMDLALLGAGFAAWRVRRGRLAVAAAGVLGATAVDAFCAEQLRGLGRLSAHADADGTLRVRKRVTVNRPPDALYRFWRDFTNHPRFMERVESVQVSSDRRTHWRARGPGGVGLEWDAEVTDERPNERIAWRSLEQAPYRHAGVVRFEPAAGGRGTTVTVELEYRPPGGALTAAAAKLIGYAPEQQLQEDLRRFKQLVETGQIAVAGGAR
jgi:uncharacterized membrane protein